MDNYMLRNVFDRKASIVISPIDCYTGQAVSGKHLDVILKGSNNKAIVKDDGFYVFVNLHHGVWEFEIISDQYFRELITVDMINSDLVVKTFITPNRNYKLDYGATFIAADSKKDVKIYAMPLDQDSGIKLRKQEGDEILVRAKANIDMLNRWFSFYQNGVMDVFQVQEAMDKNKYKIRCWSDKEHESGVSIYPVSIGKSDASGYLFCPLRDFYEEHNEILVRIDYVGEVFYQKFNIQYGKGNNIMLPV